MPKNASDRTKALAESLALEHARSRSVAICRACGVASGEPDPVKCSVCGATEFETISPEMIERIAEVEGGLTEEATYDGRTLRWSEDSKKALWTMKDAYQRRRTKARVEKQARLRKLDIVTLDFARRVIEEETGVPLELASGSAAAGLDGAAAVAAPPVGLLDEGKKLVARDAKNNPLLSAFAWTPDAVTRVLKVPAGFMRNRTQDRIEALALERGALEIDLELTEEGIDHGRRAMAEMLAGEAAGVPTAHAPVETRKGGASHSYLNEVSPRIALPPEDGKG